MMLRAILVPLDGSVFAEQSLVMGAAMAVRVRAVLHLVSVHEPLPVAALPLEVPAPVSDFDERSRLNYVEYLDALATWVRDQYGLTVATAVSTGQAPMELCAYVEANGIDFVVMATHGRSGASRWWLGSVTDRLLRRVAVPVLALPPAERSHPTGFRHLLLALDGEIEEPVLAAAAALTRPGPAPRWTLARVVEPAVPVLSGLAARPAQLPPDWNQRREIGARNDLARLADRLRGEGMDSDCQVLVGRGIARQVLELAASIGADGIVVGTHGAKGMERVVLGSVADKIVRGSTLPVLVAPTRGAVR